MKQRRRIYCSAAQRSEIWDRWQAGEPMSSIGRRFDRESSSVFSVISPTGGIRPPDRHRGKQALNLSEREEISRWLSMRRSLRSIARHLGRSPSTISREVQRNGGADRYRAAGSDQSAWDRARRPKLCKLACRPFLRRTVSTLLQRQWSPEQIALRQADAKFSHCNRAGSPSGLRLISTVVLKALRTASAIGSSEPNDAIPISVPRPGRLIQIGIPRARQEPQRWNESEAVNPDRDYSNQTAVSDFQTCFH